MNNQMSKNIINPIIGICLDSSKEQTYSDRPWYALRKDYITTLSSIGAIPILLPYCAQYLEYYTDLIDGLIVPGADYHIDPKLYGQQATREYSDNNPERVDFDCMIMQAMFDKNKPVLGICAGLQLMAVKFANGTMIQHIPSSKYQKHIQHKQNILNIPMTTPSHDINILPNTKLAEIIGSLTTSVNSHHEQAVEKINSSNFIVSARASDDIIEAIEHKTHPFFIGVEWHPEYLVNKADHNLLNAFVNAAKKSKLT